jgi:hypothetical protein
MSISAATTCGTGSVALNAILLFVVLFYVYPLKLLSAT